MKNTSDISTTHLQVPRFSKKFENRKGNLTKAETAKIIVRVKAKDVYLKMKKKYTEAH